MAWGVRNNQTGVEIEVECGNRRLRKLGWSTCKKANGLGNHSNKSIEKTDASSDDPSSEWIIQWYKNQILFSLVKKVLDQKYMINQMKKMTTS